MGGWRQGSRSAIAMKGTVARRKRYVSVEAIFDEDGRMLPTAVRWDDGRRFSIDEVRDVRRAASLKTGGDGMRYTVRIGTNITYLFYEEPRWFVEERIAELPD